MEIVLHELSEEQTGVLCEDLPSDLPPPLLGDRIHDVGDLFVHGRLLGRVRDYATTLVENGVTDDEAAQAIRDRYNTLRQHILDLVVDGKIDAVEQFLPECPQDATLAHLAFVADQAAGWLDALYEVDGFVAAQRLNTVGVLRATHHAAVEAAQVRNVKPAIAAGSEQAERPGTYL